VLLGSAAVEGDVNGLDVIDHPIRLGTRHRQDGLETSLCQLHFDVIEVHEQIRTEVDFGATDGVIGVDLREDDGVLVGGDTLEAVMKDGGLGLRT
jgi:hypothetical protein